jgi:hypothetical protein
MNKLMLLPLILVMFGCARNHFNVPVANFSEKVRVLGVAPILIDSDSDIKHPQKDELIPLVAEMNRFFEPQFVRKLKGLGNFYTVALLDSDPRQVFAELFFRREKRDDATIQYNKYFWNTGLLKDYIRKNNLDAVMFIIISGHSKLDKISSGNHLKSKTSEYNYLIMTAQILDSTGTVLWEYPNFRNRILVFDPMMNLQYPDFSESDANLSDNINVKFKTIEGIKRALSQKNKDLLLRETSESEIYGKQFDEMLSYLKYKQDNERKNPPPIKENPASLKGDEPQYKAPVVKQPAVTATEPVAPAAPSAPAEPQKPAGN